MENVKLHWQGKIVSIQPRIRLLRSFDEIGHNYLGYVLRINGTINNETKEFLIGIGKAAQAKNQFQTGDTIGGQSLPVINEKLEIAAYYKTSALKILEKAQEKTEEKTKKQSENTEPPWFGIPPKLEIYRARGHRRLDARTYEAKCLCCIWGCRMPVEIIIDHWNPSQKRYRRETFCFGPKVCPFYKSGPTRKVPGRNGMSYEEEDWIDEEAIAHREENE